MTVGDMVLRVYLGNLWLDLGGAPLIRGRGRAFWRGGDGLTVSLNEQKRIWFDHKTHDGGGVLDLIMIVRGCSRGDAVEWLSSYTGVALTDAPPRSTEDLALEVAKKKAIASALPAARHWLRSALALADETIDWLKQSTYDIENSVAIEVGAIAYWTGKIARWKRLDGEQLVDEYEDWRVRNPEFTEAMVKAGALHEEADKRVILGLGINRGFSVVGGKTA